MKKKSSYYLYFVKDMNIFKEQFENKKIITDPIKAVEKLSKMYKDLLTQSTNQDDKNKMDLTRIAIFQKGYTPNWEDPQFVNGGYYKFQLEVVNFIKLNILLDFVVKLIKKYHLIKGFIIKLKKKRGIQIFNFQLWSVSKTPNHSVQEEIQKYLETEYGSLNNKITFETFFPEPIPESDVISIKEIDGKKIYYLRFDIGIGHFIKNGNWWEEFMKPYFKKYYKPNTNVIDVGANIGMHSLTMAEMVSPNCKVFSFEPVYWDIIVMNADVNHLQDKICVFNKGLGKKNEVIEIKTFDRKMKKPYGRVSLKGEVGLKEDKDLKVKKEIGVITLDSLKLDHISEIKIDVEGMELDVLEGAKETITKNKPVIFIEILKSNYDSFINEPIMKYLTNICKYHIIAIPESYNQHDYIMIPP